MISKIFNIELWDNFVEVLSDSFQKLNDSKIGFSIGDTDKTVLIKVDNQEITSQLINGSIMNMDDFDLLFSVSEDIASQILDEPTKLVEFIDSGQLNFFCMANNSQINQKGIDEFLKSLGFVRQRTCPLSFLK